MSVEEVEGVFVITEHQLRGFATRLLMMADYYENNPIPSDVRLELLPLVPTELSAFTAPCFKLDVPRMYADAERAGGNSHFDIDKGEWVKINGSS